jgi:hypothetical protein
MSDGTLLRCAKPKTLIDLRGERRVRPSHHSPSAMTTVATPTPSEARLIEALEMLLDVFLDGRCEELTDREQEAYLVADAALSAADRRRGLV